MHFIILNKYTNYISMYLIGGKMKNRHTDNSFLNLKNNITDNNDIEII